MLHLRLGCLNSRPIRLSSFVIEVLARKCSSFLKNPDIAAWRIRKPRGKSQENWGVCPEVLVLPEKSRYCRVTHSEITWKKQGENGDWGVSPEVFIFSEKSRHCRVTHSETTRGKSQEKMGIEVLARKCFSFLKIQDVAAWRILKPHVEKSGENGDRGVTPEVLVLHEKFTYCHIYVL